jgi:hypothetical protein
MEDVIVVADVIWDLSGLEHQNEKAATGGEGPPATLRMHA